MTGRRTAMQNKVPGRGSPRWAELARRGRGLAAAGNKAEKNAKKAGAKAGLLIAARYGESAARFV
jgi:hypothetical protein